ncbi:PP2C family protein-serine/threonine phosphatase [Nonomuraea sp. NPDC050663]|uniref:PP2C family protein-serine/threonine phosphatase n=1 Tax=Nonomuraea sp. NPDC050663 TaxID=3364370 RepID=UPI0037AB91FC
MIKYGIATRQGSTDTGNADAARAYTSAQHVTGVAVIDGIGHDDATHAIVSVLAEAAARVAAVRGPLAGMLTAAQLVADRGPDDDGPDAVAVAARARPFAPTVVDWVGDARAYGWDGEWLTLHTTDHTVGQQLRANGAPWELADEHDNWVRTTLAQAAVATVYEVEIPANELVIITTDGVHDQVLHDVMADLVDAHQDNPQALADAIVTAVQADEDGYRDDATVVVIRP